MAFQQHRFWKFITEYIAGGGNAFIAVGTGASGEAASWDEFLNPLGLAFSASFDSLGPGPVSVTSDHPLFQGVSDLYYDHGNPVLDLDISDPSGQIIQSVSGSGVFGMYAPHAPNAERVVFLDGDDDGRRDPGEQWVWTDSEGHFNFTHVATGLHTVVEELPIGWRPVFPGTGSVDVTVEAGDIANLVFDSEAVPPTVANDAPEFADFLATAAVVNQAWTASAQANDEDFDGLLYSLVTSPLSMGIDPRTGLITWFPAWYQTGDQEVMVRVSDGLGGIDLLRFTVSVFTENSSPQVVSTPPQPNGTEDYGY